MGLNFFKKSSEKGNNVNKSAKAITMENANSYVVNKVLHKMLGVKDIVKGDSLYCPEWEMTLTPKVVELTDRQATLNIFMNSPEWGNELFECVSALGKDPDGAIGMACGSFLFSFIQGLGKMERDEDPEYIRTEFAGKKHEWKAYKSDLVGLGESVAAYVDSPDFYWRLLKDDIIKRLGNQKLCYVKIYVAKTDTQIIGECRIDDVKNEELSEIVAQSAVNWNIEQFASQKMFFFIKQQHSTLIPYSYWGSEGFEILKSKVKTAMELFSECDTDEQYDTLIPRTAEKIGDPVLAEECLCFIPEICAENAFHEISYSEILDIMPAGQEKISCYKNQVSDYYLIQRAVLTLLSSGVFGSDTDEIYKKYIGYSAIGHAVSSILQKGNKLDNIKMTSLIFNVSKNFEIR